MLDLKRYDPLSLDEPALSKRIHHDFEEGDRVTVHQPSHYHHGRAGVVTDARSDTRLCVKLDGPDSHEITCCEWDLIPEGMALADESPKAPSVADNLATIQRALSAGRLSDHDQVIIKTALAKIERREYTVDPCAVDDELPHGSPFRVLKLYAEKYADDADVLAKRASSPFRVGQTIKTKNDRRSGTVKTILSSGLLHVEFGAGHSGLYTVDSVEQAA